MKKEKSNCEKINLPEFKGECQKLKSTLKKIIYFENGDCFDNQNNYLGKGELIDGILNVKIENKFK